MTSGCACNMRDARAGALAKMRSRFDHRLAVSATSGHDEQRSAVEGALEPGGTGGMVFGGSMSTLRNEGCGRLVTHVAGGGRSGRADCGRTLTTERIPSR
jgi:hypothetical protein